MPWWTIAKTDDLVWGHRPVRSTLPKRRMEPGFLRVSPRQGRKGHAHAAERHGEASRRAKKGEKMTSGARRSLAQALRRLSTAKRRVYVAN